MSKSLGFLMLIDKRTAEVFDRLGDGSIERHEFLAKMELIKESVSMGLMREEQDEHETGVPA